MDHCSISNSTQGLFLSFGDTEHIDVIECNAVMLEGDRSMANYFDAFDKAPDEFYDAPEYEPCFQETDISLEDSTFGNDEFLTSMLHIDTSIFPEESVYDVAAYIRRAFNLNCSIIPKGTKRVDLDAKAIQPCLGYTTLDNVKHTLAT